MKNKQGIVVKVSGPLIVAKDMSDVQVYDVVKVGNQKLIGEVIELRGDLASIQVYEETAGLGPGDPVYFTNEPLSVELAPGLIEGIFDGIQRPLVSIYQTAGNTMPAGIDLPKIDRTKKWDFKPVLRIGDLVKPGVIIGEVVETESVVHRIMVPIAVSGKIAKIHEGLATITDTICEVINESGEISKLTMLQYWPVRKKRPYLTKLAPDKPMVTGQRTIDTLFPISIGGIAAIPGPFGSGKTVVQHQLAKWSDAEIVVYIGCGERGNEMTDVLNEFPKLIDPKTGSSLMKRTILIANTSNMPVAAREASIYTGITIAEYYRDMGYKVAIMADSTSRWAEALREMSSRLEEMPGEEGYPAYLASRLAEFYERAGYVKCLGGNREGAVTAIGAISPPGGDTSEPVSQATLRIIKVYWGLSASLAYKRHFPAIDWLKSYSLYSDTILEYYDNNIISGWRDNVIEMIAILQEEASLLEIVRLVGMDSLSTSDRAKLLVAQSIREDFLHQDAFDQIDTYTSVNKQFLMAKIILKMHEETQKALAAAKDYQIIERLPVRERIARFKFVPETDVLLEYESIKEEINQVLSAVPIKE